MIRRVALLGLVLFVALGCTRERDASARASETTEVTAEPSPAPPTASTAASVAPSSSPYEQPSDQITGDASRGHDLVVSFECNRCHEGTGIAAASFEKHCVRCHQEILRGRSNGASAATLKKWQENIVSLREVPSLVAIGKRYRPGWIERFVQAPHKVRPNLIASMPRLAISSAQAKDIVAYLAKDRGTPAAVSLADADLAHGKALYASKGCQSCHRFAGAEGEPEVMTPKGQPPVPELRTAVALAPDLRFTRERFDPGSLVAWLTDPKAVKPDTPMPITPLSANEVRDLAAYLLNARLTPAPAMQPPERLPLLERRVTYDEVNNEVFRKTCRHCHAEPDYALGDGGPGNTGGFGFPPRGLDLARYAGIAAGLINDKGERHSVFAPLPDGTPRLVASLRARSLEEIGKPMSEIRGMPLGLPALTPTQMQLVETWIAQGRPQ